MTRYLDQRGPAWWGRARRRPGPAEGGSGHHPVETGRRWRSARRGQRDRARRVGPRGLPGAQDVPAAGFLHPFAVDEQTLDIGDRVIVSELTSGPFDPHRDGVVVLADHGGWLGATVPTVPTQRGPVGTVVARVLTFVRLLPQDSDDHLLAGRGPAR